MSIVAVVVAAADAFVAAPPVDVGVADFALRVIEIVVGRQGRARRVTFFSASFR